MAVCVYFASYIHPYNESSLDLFFDLKDLNLKDFIIKRANELSQDHPNQVIRKRNREHFKLLEKCDNFEVYRKKCEKAENSHRWNR